MRLIERVRGDLEPYSTVEQYPKMEGRQLIMVLAPKKTARSPSRRTAAKAAAPKKSASVRQGGCSQGRGGSRGRHQRRSSCPGSRSPAAMAGTRRYARKVRELSCRS